METFWLPDPIKNDVSRFPDYSDYIEHLYSIFKNDILDYSPVYRRNDIGICFTDIDKGKENTFWKIISGEYHLNSSERIRLQKFNRCSHINWIKPIIENINDPLVKTFIDKSRRQPRHVIWYNYEYMIVLVEKDYKPFYRLLTAYVTDIPGFVKSEKHKFE